MAQIAGIRDTRQSITGEGSLVRYVDDQISLLEPNETPLVTLLMQLKKRSAVYSPRVEWLEDDYVARWGQVDGTTVNSNTGSTTVGVTDGTLFVVGDIAVVPKAFTSSAAPEMIRITAIATNSLTVVRAVGSSVDTIPANAALRILGSAAAEGDTPPSAKTTNVATKTSYCQIFRTAINLSKTQVASKLYGRPNGERKREQKKKLVEHKQKMNASALFGSASEGLTAGANGGPLRTTAGLNSVISTNITDAAGLLTKKTFEAFSRQAFRYGASQKLLLAAPRIISAIHDWGNSFLLVSPGEKMLGVNVEKVQTGHGVFVLARDWMLEDGIAGQNGFGASAFSIDLDAASYFYLEGNGETRDTKILEDVVKDGRDAYVDEILTEGGYKFQYEKKFAKLFNVTDYSV